MPQTPTIEPIPTIEYPAANAAPPSQKIPHPFVPGIFIQSAVLDPRSMGINADLPAHLLPGTCVSICSVVPWSLESHQFPHRRLPRYRLGASGPDPDTGKLVPFHLIRLQNTTTPIISGAEEGVGLVYKAAPIYALGTERQPWDMNQGYAVDLIREWAGDHPIGNHQGRLGVAIIIGKRPWQMDNEPTDEELKRLRELQRGHHYGLIEMADRAWVSNDAEVKKRTGSQEYRRALEFAVRDFGEKFERHPWYIQLGPEGTGALGICPACMGTFNTNGFICSICHINLAEYFSQRQIKCDAREYPGAAREMEYMKKFQTARGN
jgi:hypothetical protein